MTQTVDSFLTSYFNSNTKLEYNPYISKKISLSNPFSYIKDNLKKKEDENKIDNVIAFEMVKLTSNVENQCLSMNTNGKTRSLNFNIVFNNSQNNTIPHSHHPHPSQNQLRNIINNDKTLEDCLTYENNHKKTEVSQNCNNPNGKKNEISIRPKKIRVLKLSNTQIISSNYVNSNVNNIETDQNKERYDTLNNVGNKRIDNSNENVHENDSIYQYSNQASSDSMTENNISLFSYLPERYVRIISLIKKSFNIKKTSMNMNINTIYDDLRCEFIELIP